MRLIDTHAHIYAEQFNDDIQDVIERAKEAGLEKIFLPNIDIESIEPMKQLVADNKGFCIPMMGLHPCSVKDDYQEVLEQIKAELDSSDEYVAVGEIGIDLYWDKTHIEQQKDAFRQQIRWAKEKKMPIIIHCRDSYDEIYEILLEENDENLTGILHCFTGTVEQGQQIIALNDFYLGLGGVLTFKKSGLDAVAKELPIDKLVIETDAPYLSPTPYRGKRNESAYVQYVAEKIAEVKGMDKEEVGEITSSNALKIFKQ